MYSSIASQTSRVLVLSPCSPVDHSAGFTAAEIGPRLSLRIEAINAEHEVGLIVLAPK